MKYDLKDEQAIVLYDLIQNARILSTVRVDDCNPQVIVKDIARIIVDSGKLAALGFFTPEALDSELMRLSEK